MYIFHYCPECKEGRVVNNLHHSVLSCESCIYSEDEDTFWRIYQQEDHLRWLEDEIERCYPFRSLACLESSLAIIVGEHVLGRFKRRDNIIESTLNDLREIVEKYQVCPITFDSIEKTKTSYRRIAAANNDRDTAKYQVNLDTLDEAFKDLVTLLKSVCK